MSDKISPRLEEAFALERRVNEELSKGPQHRDDQLISDLVEINGRAEDIDREIVDLVKAMNRFEGISTIESCSGHGKTAPHIFFMTENLDALPPLLYWFDRCHAGCDWQVVVYTDCGMSPARFVANAKCLGEAAYEESRRIARAMDGYLDDLQKEDL